jgi:hypothetical protein
VGEVQNFQIFKLVLYTCITITSGVTFPISKTVFVFFRSRQTVPHKWYKDEVTLDLINEIPIHEHEWGSGGTASTFLTSA